MGLWDSIDKGLGGILPGGPTPGEVRYRDTWAAPVTGAATAAVVGTLAVPGNVLRGRFDLVDDAYRSAYSIGATGSRPEHLQGYTPRETWRDVMDTLTPDLLYEGPSDTDVRGRGGRDPRTGGADAPGDWFPDFDERWIPDLGKTFRQAGLVAAAIAAAVLLRR